MLECVEWWVEWYVVDGVVEVECGVVVDYLVVC